MYLMARAIQFFTPGIPMIYYVGLLAGENDLQVRTWQGVLCTNAHLPAQAAYGSARDSSPRSLTSDIIKLPLSRSDPQAHQTWVENLLHIPRHHGTNAVLPEAKCLLTIAAVTGVTIISMFMLCDQ